jgi:hypothetical protein
LNFNRECIPPVTRRSPQRSCLSKVGIPFSGAAKVYGRKSEHEERIRKAMVDKLSTSPMSVLE